jgi:hypothetical protein
MAFEFTPLPYKYDVYHKDGMIFNKENNERLILFILPQSNEGDNSLYIPFSLCDEFNIPLFNSVSLSELYVEFNYFCKQSQIMRLKPFYIAMNIVHFERSVVKAFPLTYHEIFENDVYEDEFLKFFDISEEPSQLIDQVCAYLILNVLNYKSYANGKNDIEYMKTIMRIVKNP